MNRALKITDGTNTKRTEFPISFDNLVALVAGWIPIDSDKVYTFKDTKTNFIISNDFDYQKFKNSPQSGTPKLLVIVNAKNNQINPVNEVNSFNKNVPQIESNVVNEPPKENKEVDLEDQFKQSIKAIVQEKIKKMEEEMINEITSKVSLSSQSKILSSQMSKVDNQVVHKGINCSNCGMKDIKGIRYKCSVCDNYNLCEACESASTHDLNHILIKMRIPFEEKDIPNTKFKYVVDGYSFDYSPKTFHGFFFDKYQMQVKLVNTGSSYWLPGSTFKCIDSESDIVGTAPAIGTKVLPGKDIFLELTFYNGKRSGKSYSYWQMYNYKGIPFGNVAKFEFNLQEH